MALKDSIYIRENEMICFGESLFLFDESGRCNAFQLKSFPFFLLRMFV